MIIDQLFENKKNTNESLADEFMAMARAKGMNPRLAGTPDQERARTDAMLKQRAADRANAPKPQPIDAETRAHLQDQLKSLEATFDPNYEYSDDHGFWKEQSSIAQQINRIKAELSKGVAEDTDNPYGYRKGQTVKLSDGKQGSVIDIFDDSIEVLLPGGRTVTVAFQDAQVLDEQGLAEGKRNKKRKLDEAWLMEDPVYRKFKRVGRYIAERKLTEPEILKIFADAETGMTDKATGANRTFLGRGKDTTMDFAGGVADALKGVWGGIQSNVGVQAVDVAYDKATDALADLTGGQKGAIMQALKKYRMLAKEYPKTAGLAKGALVAITGLATGGAGLPAVAALVYGLDSAIKGEKFSDIALKAGGAAATAWAGQKLASAFGGDGAAGADAGGMGDPSQLPPFDDAGNLSPGFHISPDDGAPFYTGELAPTPTDIAAGYGPDGAAGLTTGAETGASTGADIFGGGTYTIQKGDQLGYIAQANGVSVEDIRGINPQIDFSKPLQPGTEITLPVTGTPGEGSVWQSYQGGMYGDKAASPELLGGPGAGDVAASAAAVPTPSPLNLQPPAMPGGPQFGTVTLPDGQTLKAAAFPEGGITPRLPVGSTPVTINYNGQELTGRIVNDTVYFTKFPADAVGSTTTSSAGTLSGVTGQQIMASPVYQQAYAQELARYGAEPSARAIQAAQQIATLKAKAAMVGAVRENTDWISKVKMRRLPVDKMIDQKLTTLSWALNESVGKPQGRSMHLTPMGVYTVFENIRRVAEKLEPTGPGREALPDLYRPDMPDALTQPADPAKKSWFGKGLDYLDRGTKAVGGAISNFGHQLTTGVTKEKLKMNWHQAGKPTDSDQLSAWLVKQGVPIGVVNSVYEKMGLPVSAEPVAATDPAETEPQAKTGGAQRQMAFYGTNPATNKPWTYDELMAKSQTTPTSDPAPAELDAEAGANTDTTTAGAGAGAGVFGNMAAQLAARPTTSSTGGTTTGVSGVGKGVVRHTASATNPNQPKPVTPTAKPAAEPSVPSSTAELPAGGGAGIRAANPFGSMASSLSGDNKAAADLAAADLENLGAAGTASAANKTRMASRIPKKAPVAETQQARRIVGVLKKPVSEMLQMVETKEDVNRIKQFIDQTFTKYGAVNESTFAVRNIMIEHVTKVGAQRRREHARKGA
jgi:LysM repeat protein